MSPTAKNICALLLITATGLVLCGLLIYGSLDRSRVHAAQTNVDFVLGQLRNSMEANVNLGLPLQDIRLAQDLIEEVRAGDPQILAVEIISAAGLSQFNTDRGSIGEPIRSSWQEAITHANDHGGWSVQEFGDLVVGEVIRNDFGEPVGYIAITLAGQSREDYASTIAVTMLSFSAFILPLALLVVAAAALMILRHASTNLRQTLRRLTEPAPSPAVTFGMTDAATPLPDLASQARVAISDRIASLDDTAQAVLALDEDSEPNATI